MKRNGWSVLALIIALGSPSCGSAPTQPTGEISAQARAYLDQLIAIMQVKSIKRLTIDWDTFRSSVFTRAAGAQTITDTYPAIRVALELLGDGHSSLRTPTGSVIFVPNRTCSASGGTMPALPATIGYVKVGAFGGSGAAANAFAIGIQSAIQSADRDGLIGWIVDLRGNGGGNMWPMIAGIGPVLGEDILGYFIDPNGVENKWEYRDGASWLDGFAATSVTTPYRLRRERPRVAVLTDNVVASSGEATVIAFRQRPDTRSFGAPTCGLSTVNQGFTMTDGALLLLTTAVLADRSRTKYGDAIPPDEIESDPLQAVQRAIAWLQLEAQAPRSRVTR